MDNNITDIKDFTDAILNLRSSMKKYVQRKIREDKLDLTYEMLQVMSVLWSRGSLNQQDIADSIQKNKASLTSLLDNLAKRGLVVRTEDTSDRRNKIITLTKSGKEFEQQLSPLLSGFYQTAHCKISKTELRKMTELLRTMSNNLL
jgi:DNA-binding MarR family transcriptional regulator